MKKICIYGLGAIGGLMAARLARAGVAVNAIARGATLEAVRQRGLELRSTHEGRIVVEHLPVHAVRDPADLGPQDLVILAVKATGLESVAREIAPLLGPDTTVLSAMNGVPWWFLHGLSSELSALRLDSVDHGGVVSQAIAPQRVVGCVTHLSAATPAPGVVQQVAGNRLIVSDPSGGADTPRCQAVAGLLEQAQFDVERCPSIQREIWFKLWGNMTVNPISALTGATGDRIVGDDYVRAFMSRCMLEAAALGSRLGLPIEADPESRHAVTRQLGAFRTSMLQDMEAGKPVELDALVTVVVEMAHQLQVPTPQIETLLGLARLKARVAGLYPD